MIMRSSNGAPDHGTAKRAGVGPVAVHRPDPARHVEVRAQKARARIEWTFPEAALPANYLAYN